MAQRNLTAQEFIQNAFAPQIAILCSEDADNICLKNNLRFVELLQPYCRTSEARVADPSGTIFTLKSFKMCFEDMNRRPPQPTLGKKILSEAVSSTSWDPEISKVIGSWTGGMNITLDLQTATPWFEDWRDIFLQIQYPSDHEFTKHYIACVFVISAGSENPLDQLNRLCQYQHQQQHQNPTRFPKWFSPNIMKYYLLVRDVEDVDSTKADQVYEQMTSAYGSINCHMLQINSRPLLQADANMPDPWQRLLQHRGLAEGSGVGASGSSEASSGTGTPREDLVGLPTRVTEGDSSESSSDTPTHPLSPVAPPLDEKNGLVDSFPPPDVPLLMNRQTLPSVGALPSQVVQHGGCLTSSDLDRIRIFVEEFCHRALVPHVERQIRHLNDVVTNRSRSKSLFSATKRWLGASSKPPAGGANSVVYSQEATELQTRRLGDLCFMFGLYEVAYNAYYTAKNDFKGDQAWLYFAGAQEMAALSAFMQNPAEYPKRYFEGSLHTYLNVCKVYNFAIRLTLLSTEVLKHCGEFGEAAMMFIKMTSEESDLLSALMLEQAAHCFINARRPLPRKYAFHMTLAGHRFSKAGQRSHSLRAYKQAFQVYFNRGWILAEDHIHYTMGKQAFQLRLNKESLEATTRLIDQGAKTESSTQQSGTQQAAYMREFLNVLDKCLREETDFEKNLIALPVPILDGQSTKVILGDPLDKPDDLQWSAASHVNFTDEDVKERRWFALERELLVAAQGPSMIFRPNLQRLTASTPNTQPSSVPVMERVTLQIKLKNPLLISLTLSSIRPVYSFFNESGQEELSACGESREDDPCVRYDPVKSLIMPPESEEVILLSIWPQRLGKVVIRGIAYHIAITPEVSPPPGEQPRSGACLGVTVQQGIELRGPRLNSTLPEKTSVVYAKDERLNIRVTPSMPRLHAAFRNLPAILSCGELRRVDVHLANVGAAPLTSLWVGVSKARNVYFTLESSDLEGTRVTEPQLGIPLESSVQRVRHVEKTKDCSSVSRVQKVPLPTGCLAVGDTLKGHLWLHAPQSPSDAFDVEVLFYYHGKEGSSKNRYRLLRHLSSIYLYPSLSIKVKSFPSQGLLPANKNEEESRHTNTHHSNLVFHVKNKCEVGNGGDIIDLIGVSANSGYYGLIQHSLKGVMSVRTNESCQLCVQCAHVQEGKEKGLVLSYVSANNTHDQSSLLPCWAQFALRERLKIPELTLEPPPPNPSASYEPPPPTLEQIDGKKLKEALQLDLVASVLWKCKRGDEEIEGLHSMYLDDMVEETMGDEDLAMGVEEERPPVRIIPEEEVDLCVASPLPPVSALQNLIKVSLEIPSEVSHDFRKEALCRIQFSATFYNSSACPHFVEVELSSKALASTEEGQTQMFSPQASLNLICVGASTRGLKLDAFQSKSLQVRSVVTRPGTFSLGGVYVRARRENSNEWVPQVCHQVQCGVLVKSEAPTAMDRHMASELASIHAVSSGSAHS